MRIYTTEDIMQFDGDEGNFLKVDDVIEMLESIDTTCGDYAYVDIMRILDKLFCYNKGENL